MNLSISKASEEWNVLQTTLYKKLNSGKISKSSDGGVDTAEILRVFGESKKMTL